MRMTEFSDQEKFNKTKKGFEKGGTLKILIQ